MEIEDILKEESLLNKLEVVHLIFTPINSPFQNWLLRSIIRPVQMDDIMNETEWLIQKIR